MSEIYEPAEDSELIRSHVKDYAKGVVLDMGAGSGVLSEESAKSRRVVKVFGVDINPEAIKHCIRNQKSRKIVYMASNLFSRFYEDERFLDVKFDLIMFNAPYLPDDLRTRDRALDGGINGHGLICKFLHQAEEFLRPNGRILLVFSSLTGRDMLEKFMVKNRWLFKEIGRVHISFEDIFLYELCRKA
jgi:release factor glutamine methyltransferase